MVEDPDVRPPRLPRFLVNVLAAVSYVISVLIIVLGFPCWRCSSW